MSVFLQKPIYELGLNKSVICYISTGIFVIFQQYESLQD